MKNTHMIGARLCALLFAVLISSVALAGPAKVEVCHLPLDNPENFHTIKISEKALANHLAHGDLTGACNSVCAALCDDGNACTVDDTADCEQNGCPVTSIPVDCDDGLYCTDDSCDIQTGCVYTPTDMCELADLCMTSTCLESDEVCSQPTPIICATGEACNPGNGECEPVDEPDVCPCFDADDLSDLGATQGACGDNFPSDGTALAAHVNGSIACSGLVCTAPADALSCAVRVGPSGNAVSVLPVTEGEDVVCRTLIVSQCSAGSDGPSNSSSTSSSEGISIPVFDN